MDPASYGPRGGLPVRRIPVAQREKQLWWELLVLPTQDS